MQVLNLGFVDLVDVMGTPGEIARAARISYRNFGEHMQGDFLSDLRLITRLYRDEHMSPFEMVQIKYHVKAPRFVVQQWERHRMASYNEESQRYKEPAMDFFRPLAWRLQDQTNKQGSSDAVVDDEHAQRLYDMHDNVLQAAEEFYHAATDLGVSRELARIDLPLGIYSEFVTSMNLRNLLHFFHLRRDPHAQYEIRVYADAMYELLYASSQNFEALFAALERVDEEKQRHADA